MQAELTTGTATIYCDNQSALDQIFNCQQASRNPYAYLKADIDLITCARTIIRKLPLRVKLSHKWVSRVCGHTPPLFGSIAMQ
jgi:hypothetical protein